MMTPALTIQKKRDGKELTSSEIKDFIQGLSNGNVADYQAAAFLMAVYFRGMTLTETVALTEAMLDSGERYDLSSIPGVKVDKHSTGGVGDKVSLILAPLAAACGLKVPSMAGRGLGHSGGTIDKLEAIPGYTAQLPKSRFEAALNEVGCAIISQSDQIAVADKKLYALRDVTATVECIPLIVGSILSKKVAEGTQGLVLDVKVGNGAFMRSREEARRLGKTITQVAKRLGVKCRAILTNMDQPLGYSVGNLSEVLECVEVLKGEKHKHSDLTSVDLKELTIQLCAHMLELGGVAKKLADGRKLAMERLNDGSAWKVFQEMIKFQGGSLDKALSPQKPRRTEIWTAPKRGFITKMDSRQIGRILVELGGGRKKASDRIDPLVGLVFHRKLGAKVQPGDPIAEVTLPEESSSSAVAGLKTTFLESIEISGTRKPVPKLIYEVVN